MTITRHSRLAKLLCLTLTLILGLLTSTAAQALVFQVTSPDGTDAVEKSYLSSDVVVHLERGAIVELTPEDVSRRGSYLQILLPGSDTTAWVRADSGEVKLYSQSYALLIAINDYPGERDDLTTPRADIGKLKSLLIELDFPAKNITILDTPKQTERAALLNALRKMWNTAEHDRVFIAYSGHGESEPEMGYIVPSGASPGSDFANYIPMNQLRWYYERIPARHVFLLFDSCFSGSVYQDSQRGTSLDLARFSNDIPKWLRNVTSLKARQAITAGTAAQTVPDNGRFMESFIQAFTRMVDFAAPGFITARDVMNHMSKQSLEGLTPTPGDLFGHERGDFIFRGDPYAGTENLDVQEVQEDRDALARVEELERIIAALKDQATWALTLEQRIGVGSVVTISYDRLLASEAKPPEYMAVRVTPLPWSSFMSARQISEATLYSEDFIPVVPGKTGIYEVFGLDSMLRSIAVANKIQFNSVRLELGFPSKDRTPFTALATLEYVLPELIKP